MNASEINEPGSGDQLQTLELVRDELWGLVQSQRNELEETTFKLKRSLQALSFYASAENWSEEQYGYKMDKGEQARKALAELGIFSIRRD